MVTSRGTRPRSRSPKVPKKDGPRIRPATSSRNPFRPAGRHRLDVRASGFESGSQGSSREIISERRIVLNGRRLGDNPSRL